MIIYCHFVMIIYYFFLEHILLFHHQSIFTSLHLDASYIIFFNMH